MSANSLYGGIFPSINFGALMSGQKIPKVDGSFDEVPAYIRDMRENVTNTYTECMAAIKATHSIYKD